jgi:predicted phage terminase large subunit-like protein
MPKLNLPKKPVTKAQFRELAAKATAQVAQQRAAAQVEAEELAAGRATFTEADGTREQRLARTRNSPIEFGRTYLPHYFEQPSAPHHEVLDKVLSGNYTEADLKRWAEEFGIEVHAGDVELRLMAICIFRGGGKSVIALLCDLLRRICHGLDPYMIIVSDTFDQAASQLEDIKDELAFNEKIKADFGNLKPSAAAWDDLPIQQTSDGRVVWKEGRIVTANNIRVDGLGVGAKMRGRRYGRKRPTYVPCDDLDNDENVMTKEQRDKRWNWFISAVVPALDPKVGRAVIIGTMIHFDCVIARAVRKVDDEDRRMFTSIVFAALRRNKQGALESVWPERFSTESLMRKKALLGPSKFGAEYMNDPRDPETQIFDPDQFQYYASGDLESRKLTRVIYVDPSKGKKGKGRKKSDFSGFADVLVDTEQRITFILNAYRKRLTPNAAKTEIVDRYLEAAKGKWPVELWIEENSFGDILGETFQEELRRRGADVIVNTLLHTAEKNSRLENHSIRVVNGGVRFPDRWEREDRRPEWFSEYVDFPAGAFDDTIDSIESADHIGMELIVGKVEFKSSGKKSGSAMMKGF